MVISFGGSGIGFGCVWKVCWNYLLNTVFHATVCKMLYVQNLYFTSEKVMIRWWAQHAQISFSISQCCWQLVAVGICLKASLPKLHQKQHAEKKLAPRQESAVKTDYLKFTVQSLAYLRLGFKAKMNAVWSQTKEDITPAINPTWHWKVTFFYRR